MASILFVAPAYGLWYHENEQTNDLSESNTEAINCIVESFSTRDATSLHNVNTLIRFFDEFGQFLRHIEGQTSADPLLHSSDDAEKSLKGVTITANAKDLEKCLGD